MKFRASAVATKEMPDLKSFVIALAEDAEGSGRALTLARGLTPPTEQEVALGFDTYSLSTESGFTVYGGVTSWSLDRNSLKIVLSPDASETLDVDGGYVIRFDIDEPTWQALRQGLERIFGDGRQLRDRD